jgi:secondary thiamine-phosphate synthase enzyme
MNIAWHTLPLKSNSRIELKDLTERLRELIKETKIRDGFLNLMSLHTTTALFVNEWQSALLDDIREFIHSLVDDEGFYKHNSPEFSDCERQNATSHLRSLLLGGNKSLTILVRDGRLLLGRWQSVIFAELDGPQDRMLQVQVVGQ